MQERRGKMIPQRIMLSLIFISIGISIARHGEQKNEKHNAVITLLNATITIAILYWGGFFDSFLK